MCGFVGFFQKSIRYSHEQSIELLRKMALCIQHRGPDDEGLWLSPDKRLAFGFRRLSIVELSQAGHQPMSSASGRFVLMFNGEIYNHQDLRKELSIQNWRGGSDTETLLAGFEAWGISNTIQKTVGMFAMAIWDRESSSLSLVRDRVGEKPLYYGWQNNIFLFGSELKGLKAHPSFSAEIDRNSLASFLRYNYMLAPHTIYQNIYKLIPGQILNLNLNNFSFETKTYWSAIDTVLAGIASPFKGSEQEATQALEEKLTQSIQKQMIADVPLGAFLSGGVDSSTVVALMQKSSTRPVKTFTIGFHEEEFNEAIYAKEVAKHLKTEHTELYVTAQQAMDVIPKLPGLYDEPFADSSQIPTYLVSELARKHVTVSLSGDAGDELFCGYSRYTITAKLARKIERMPSFAKTLLEKIIYLLSPKQWDTLLALVPRKIKGKQPGWKLHKGAKLLKCSKEDIYFNLISLWKEPDKLVLNSKEPKTFLVGDVPDLPNVPFIEKMMALDLITYLPDDILVKVDRAAMGVSLETRVPFLDHRVIEFAWQLPQKMKLRKGVSKWVLRQILYKYVPKSLIERPKMGFGIPIDMWLRGPLKDWAESLINEKRLKEEAYFDAAIIQKAWKEELSGLNNSAKLWSILMFQSWRENT